MNKVVRKQEKKRKVKYLAFTMIEMLITMAILIIIFLTINEVLLNLVKTSNTTSARMLMRAEGEFIAEVFRRDLRNSAVDSVKLYSRRDEDQPGVISFADYQVQGITGIWNEEELPFTEIHFRPSNDFTGRVSCIGFFQDEDTGQGYIIKSSGFVNVNWDDYNPNFCFPITLNNNFRKNFMVLSSDLINIENLSITKYVGGVNVYYLIEIDIQPAWGVGGLSNYRVRNDKIKHRKSFVVQTRLVQQYQSI